MGQISHFTRLQPPLAPEFPPEPPVVPPVVVPPVVVPPVVAPGRAQSFLQESVSSVLPSSQASAPSVRPSPQTVTRPNFTTKASVPPFASRSGPEITGKVDWVDVVFPTI